MMYKSTLIPNLLLVVAPCLIPRISPGGESYGDPILQILFIVLILPALAVLLNLKLAKTNSSHCPRLTTFLVCLLGSSLAYLKWVALTPHTFLQTGSEMTFVFFYLSSVVHAVLLFAIFSAISSGRIAKHSLET